MQLRVLKDFLKLSFIMMSVCFSPTLEAFAFGSLDEHLTQYKEKPKETIGNKPVSGADEPTVELLLKHEGPSSENSAPHMKDREKTSIYEAEEALYNSVKEQANVLRKIRSRIGDIYVSYEKDRLIETIKDYDVIVRSQLYLQTRFFDVLEAIPQLKEMEIQEITNAGGNSSSTEQRYKLAEKLMKEFPLSYILRKNEKELINIDPKNGGNIFAAGDAFKKNFFIPTLSEEQKKDPLVGSLFETKRAMRQLVIFENSLKNYLFGAYVRAYLAERANRAGIGAHLFDRKVFFKDNPWEITLQTWITDAVGNLMNNSVLGSVWNFMTGNKNTVSVNSGRRGEEPEPIPVDSIRQAIALNTILWVRGNLELASLIMLTTARIEVEAMLATNQVLPYEDMEWINPLDKNVWGILLSGDDVKWIAPSIARGVE